jgi:hypothetical protein
MGHLNPPYINGCIFIVSTVVLVRPGMSRYLTCLCSTVYRPVIQCCATLLSSSEIQVTKAQIQINTN